AFEEIRRGVGVFTERGGAIGYLATDEALVMVDTAYPEQAQTAYDGLDERTPGRASVIDLLVNTHHHGDHTAGNSTLGPLAARHVAHEAVPGLQRAASVRRGSLEEQAYPRETYSGLWRTDVGDETVALHDFGPGHTAGDSVVHFERADVVHMGDLVFNRMPCFIDLAAGATTEGWIGVLERVHDTFTDETRFIFGHGHPDHGVVGSRADLLVMRDFLARLQELVSGGLRREISVDTLVEMVQSSDAFDSHRLEAWPAGLPNAVRAVAEEMAR
ncbi:MAG: MBL fold metallo-hydrolase, partial [Bacteroidota bacterium]